MESRICYSPSPAMAPRRRQVAQPVDHENAAAAHRETLQQHQTREDQNDRLHDVEAGHAADLR